MQRARKIERFLSQPFFVAEEFTGTPGVYVPIEETMRGFEEIIEGKHDDLPENAFFLKGTIDEVVEAARKALDGPQKFPCRGPDARGRGLHDEVEILDADDLGSIGILSRHTPLLAPSSRRAQLYRWESEALRFAQGEGFVQFGQPRADAGRGGHSNRQRLDPANTA